MLLAIPLGLEHSLLFWGLSGNLFVWDNTKKKIKKREDESVACQVLFGSAGQLNWLSAEPDESCRSKRRGRALGTGTCPCRTYGGKHWLLSRYHVGAVFLWQSSSSPLSILCCTLKKKKINLLCKATEFTPSSPRISGLGRFRSAFVLWIENADFKHTAVERGPLKFQPTAPLNSTDGARRAYSKTPLFIFPCPSGAPFLGKAGCFSRANWGSQFPCKADEGHLASGSGYLLQIICCTNFFLSFTTDLWKYSEFLCGFFFCFIPSPLFFSPLILLTSYFW